jgi:hypothetical protein
MAKYKVGHFIQVDRSIFQNPAFTTLSPQSKWLYICITELEHRFTSGHKRNETFYHADADLSALSGIPLRSFKRYKKELTASGFVTTTKRKTSSGKVITVYEICRRIHFDTYQAYLNSPYWEKTATTKRKSVAYRCEECHAAAPLDVHHKHYNTLHSESMTDLLALCRPCHQKK